MNEIFIGAWNKGLQWLLQCSGAVMQRSVGCRGLEPCLLALPSLLLVSSISVTALFVLSLLGIGMRSCSVAGVCSAE